MNVAARTGAILAIRPDGAAVVHAAGQRIEIPGGDVDETRIAAVAGLTSVALAAGTPIATLIVEAAAVRTAMIAGDGFQVGDVLDAETAAAIDVDEDGTAHVQLHDLQVDVEGEDVRAAALTLVADVAAALGRSVGVTATDAGTVRHLQVGVDGVPVLQEPASTPAPEQPAPTPTPKGRAVKAARPRRGRAAPVAAPVEPVTAPVDETPVAAETSEPDAAAVETPAPVAGDAPTEVEQPEIPVDQVAEVDVDDERVEDPADVTTDAVPAETVLEVVDVVEVPAVEDRDRDRDDEQHQVEVERKAPAAASPSTTSKDLVTVPAKSEASERPSRVRRLVQRARHAAMVVTLVAVIAGLTAAGISGVQATTHSDALARYALVSADLTEVRDDVRAALEEAQALGDLSAQVADESTTAALATAIERATDVVEGEDPGAGSSWRYWTKAALSEQTDALSSEITKAKAIAAALDGAVRAVNASHEAWAAEQDPAADLSGAIDALSWAIDAATAVLAESDGRVGDNAVRQTLADAIAAATTVRDTAPAVDAPGPERAAAAIAARDQTTTLGAAQHAVMTARNTWEASQSAPAAQQPAPGTGNASTGASAGAGAAAGSANAGTASSAASGEFTVDAAAVPPSADRPGVATVQVAVSGNAGESVAVLLTVAGITTQIGTVSGSGIVTGSAEGLPTGTWPWHVTVAGLQASGTPDIRVY